MGFWKKINHRLKTRRENERVDVRVARGKCSGATHHSRTVDTSQMSLRHRADQMWSVHTTECYPAVKGAQLWRSRHHGSIWATSAARNKPPKSHTPLDAVPRRPRRGESADGTQTWGCQALGGGREWLLVMECSRTRERCLVDSLNALNCS